jgi:hypothetical protein
VWWWWDSIAIVLRHGENGRRLNEGWIGIRKELDMERVIMMISSMSSISANEGLYFVIVLQWRKKRMRRLKRKRRKMRARSK